MRFSPTTVLLVLSSTAYAQFPNSLHRRHHEHARSVESALARRAASYKLVDNYDKNSFLNMVNFYTGGDPTHGSVKYLSKSAASSAGLAVVEDDGTILLAVDDTTQLTPGQKRNSVRVSSKKTYNAGTLFLADIQAMPTGCATWPAYWTVGPNWPNGGEVDIIEGVNTQSTNQITAHTGGVCDLDKSLNTTGRIVGSSCQSSNGNNAGCAFAIDDTKTYGAGFNKNGGGVYAHTWEDDAITVWFFPRGAIPDDVSSGKPDPSSWGAAAAVFSSNAQCNIGESFHDHQIVFDITLCGDWAGAAYSNMGCPGTCAQRVADPSNFKDAKFKINYLKVYQHN
ncbi:hypothetical protein NLI96_g7496 [Meripilus lineatus]|uniref:GH16 domain-containing protein n=1 Tax=Meripilus lineatus TaxID=2056292 RepID=A0AAD5UZ41_9APHY|nr:hypothetical protein NLI96_g7496 [Physisporinus lineatus]